MSAEFQLIDNQIKSSYQGAQQVEIIARELEDRIAQIDGAKRHLPARSFGQPVDLSKIRSNLTLSSLIARDSADLAHFVGLDAGISLSIDERQEARAKAEQSLQERTEELRAKNQAGAQRRAHNLSYGRNSLTGGLF